MSQDQFADLPNGIRLCYRDYGAGAPLLLVIGLGIQLNAWPRAMITGLMARHFRVIVFDNRDSGRSSQIPTPPPSNVRLFLRRARPQDYDLAAMAEDAVFLMDHLGIEAAHLVGMSMGGMIAQTIAARWPRRVLSLTSIFSNTGARRSGQPHTKMILRLMLPRTRTRTGARRRYLGTMRRIAGTTYRLNVAAHLAYFDEAWARAGGSRHEGQSRQIAAIIKSGDRTAELGRISAPSLVIHGEADPMVDPSGGIATQAAIPGAKLVTIPGMGHDLADGVVPRLVELIAENAQAAV